MVITRLAWASSNGPAKTDRRRSADSSVGLSSEQLQVCVGYELGGQQIDILPLDADDIVACRPVYESLPGWRESTAGLTNWEQLPTNARRYLERIQQLIGAPIDMV